MKTILFEFYFKRIYTKYFLNITIKYRRYNSSDETSEDVHQLATVTQLRRLLVYVIPDFVALSNISRK